MHFYRGFYIIDYKHVRGRFGPGAQGLDSRDSGETCRDHNALSPSWAPRARGSQGKPPASDT
eukprot:1411112-Pleurochrysis_carterae.AAC.2